MDSQTSVVETLGDEERIKKYYVLRDSLIEMHIDMAEAIKKGGIYDAEGLYYFTKSTQILLNDL